MIRDPQLLEALIDSARLFATQMCGRGADRVLRRVGGAGFERFYRAGRLLRIYEGARQIHQLVIARNLLREVRGS